MISAGTAGSCKASVVPLPPGNQSSLCLNLILLLQPKTVGWTILHYSPACSCIQSQKARLKQWDLTHVMSGWANVLIYDVLQNPAV